MNVIVAYLGQRTLDVVLGDLASETSMTTFYAPNVRIHRGTDNEFRVEFRNRNAGPANIEGIEASFLITDRRTSTVHLERTISRLDAANGIGMVTLDASDIAELDDRFYSWSVCIRDSSSDRSSAAWVDDEYGALGGLEVLDGPWPGYRNGIEETFGFGNEGSAISVAGNSSSLHSAQIWFGEEYTGRLLIQAAPDSDGEFITVKTMEYDSRTNTDLANWFGSFGTIRFVRDGEGLSRVLYRGG